VLVKELQSLALNITPEKNKSKVASILSEKNEALSEEEEKKKKIKEKLKV